MGDIVYVADPGEKYRVISSLGISVEAMKLYDSFGDIVILLFCGDEYRLLVHRLSIVLSDIRLVESNVVCVLIAFRGEGTETQVFICKRF